MSLTIERLKSWLNGNQPRRERMCAQILAQMDGYSNIHLRRPQGGPDGGRDLEATYRRNQTIFGAVGFKNDANDSAENKAWARNKFAEDCRKALKSNPSLHGFIFFTNVDLTPTEESNLKQIALNEGLAQVEIIARENMRLYLDGPSGLSTRYQFLDISMSDEEQKVFFQTYGSRLEDIILNRFGYIEEKIERLEFLSESSFPVDRIGLVLFFARPLAANELRKCAVRIRISPDLRHWAKRAVSGSEPQLWIAVKAELDSERPNFVAFDTQLRTTLFNGSQPEEIRTNARDWRDDPTIEQIDCFCYHVRGKMPFDSLMDLDRRMINAEISENFLGKIAQIWLIIGDYIACRVDAPPDTPVTEEELIAMATRVGLPHINAIKTHSLQQTGDEWPYEEQRPNWIRLAGAYPWRGPEINFESYRPERLDKFVVPESEEDANDGPQHR